MEAKNKPALKIDGKFELDNLNYDEYLYHLDKEHVMKEKYAKQLLDFEREDRAM